MCYGNWNVILTREVKIYENNTVVMQESLGLKTVLP